MARGSHVACLQTWHTLETVDTPSRGKPTGVIRSSWVIGDCYSPDDEEKFGCRRGRLQKHLISSNSGLVCVVYWEMTQDLGVNPLPCTKSCEENFRFFQKTKFEKSK